ncbi:nuclear transcription factor Y subunit A-3 isoform X1 [Solanum dulcamara]|uniref:nuclear transcription factor Y subunit A-3 isoform X1 n=2 Tax=Solanum dulcamara TaxID=45834 RepID=UPI002486AF57|nr:nuclear transcription factor Y subunit A-3 isoform X1 [Solanum dulcamara]
MMQQMSTIPGPQNTKKMNFHFQDQDSSSTQSTSQSCPEAANERERKIHGKSSMPLRAGSFRSSGKSDDSQSVSSQEHGWTYDTIQKSFAVVPFPHPDPYYHGLVAAYGNQTMVQSQMLGRVSPRVPLPLDLKQDEPIFVNAKQYQAILRRRQYRARLEAQNKLSKGRKPYLHESRHRHALNRARGPGGRFVNMKKPRESKSPDFINGQENQVPDELQLNTKMLEHDVHQSGSYSGITGGDAIYHHQLFKYSALSACIGGASQQEKEKKDNISNPCL